MSSNPSTSSPGVPCQPVSATGRRLAQADPRWLWPAFARCVRRLRPRLVLVENVPGLLVQGMGDVLGDLAELGYGAEWTCLSAADVGAPHLRRRVFVVADAAAQDYKGPQGDRPNRNGGVDLPTVLGGVPNPTWIEWLMGFPAGWTDCAD